MKNKKICVSLMVFILLRITFFLAAEDAGLSIAVKTNPENPSALSFWTLSLLVDHPVPDEVTVMVPPLPGALYLDRLRKVPSEPRKTLVEYRFLLNSAGTVTIDPFQVITPFGAALTFPFVLRVAEAGKKQEPFPLVWEGRRTIPAGEEAVFRLRAEGGNQVPVFPPARALMPEVPRDLILEGEESSGSEKEAGIVFILKLTALGPGAFTIPGRTLGAEDTVFAIPALGISAESAALIADNEKNADNKIKNGDTESDAGKILPSFPALEPAAGRHPVLANIFRGDIEGVYHTARNLWERRYPAEALAELRRNERDHPAGSLFLVLRREAEQSLGIYSAAAENRLSRKWLFVFFSALFAAVFLFFRKKFFALRGRKGVFCFTALVLAAGVLCFQAGGKDGFGVSRGSVFRRVPDAAGEAAGSFREGQPLGIHRGKNGGRKGWVWADGGEGESGWIEAERIIFY